MTKATRKIKGFNFASEGAHVALVDKAANGQSVLVMKSLTATEEDITKALAKDVTVKMNIMEFLTRYLNLWYSDAEVVAGLMGYSAEDIDAPFEDYAMTWVERLQERIDTVEINKSAEPIEKLVEKFDSFKDKYLEKNLSSLVEGGDKAALEDEDVVNKTEDEKSINKEVKSKMSEKENEVITQKSIEEMVQKAAADLAKEQIDKIEKAYADREKVATQELQVLKAAHDARVHQEFVAKATEYAALVGEEADVEAIAKALRAVEAIEEAAPLMAVLKSLKDAAGKEELLVEVGKSATVEQPSDLDSQVIAIAKSLIEADPKLTQRQAEMRAYEQVVQA